MKVGIIGGGIAGLTAAYELCKRGIAVHLFEKESFLGGLASSTNINGNYLEKYYHFICLGDHDLIEMLKDLGQSDQLRWVYPHMGLYHGGRLYSVGNPWDIIFLPGLNAFDKFKLIQGAIKTRTMPEHGWKDIEGLKARDWLIKVFGSNTYKILYEPMLRLKFGKYAEDLSAAWIWARLKRHGYSRTKILMREKVGYLNAGTQFLIDTLASRIIKMGGSIRQKTAIEKIVIQNSEVKSLIVEGNPEAFDMVLSTIPIPQLLGLIPPEDSNLLEKAKQIKSIGVKCLRVRLRKKLTSHYWINFIEESSSFAGIIEFTNLNPLTYLNGDSIIYVPEYSDMHEHTSLKDDDFFNRCFSNCLRIVNQNISEKDIVDYQIFKDINAQPLCPTNFSNTIPEMKSPIKGLFISDSCQLHPHDRSISSSISLGKKIAAIAINMDVEKSVRCARSC